jgi:hypothetical protein
VFARNNSVDNTDFLGLVTAAQVTALVNSELSGVAGAGTFTATPGVAGNCLTYALGLPAGAVAVSVAAARATMVAKCTLVDVGPCPPCSNRVMFFELTPAEDQNVNDYHVVNMGPEGSGAPFGIAQMGGLGVVNNISDSTAHTHRWYGTVLPGLGVQAQTIVSTERYCCPIPAPEAE